VRGRPRKVAKEPQPQPQLLEPIIKHPLVKGTVLDGSVKQSDDKEAYDKYYATLVKRITRQAFNEERTWNAMKKRIAQLINSNALIKDYINDNPKLAMHYIKMGIKL
jgi:hypothetical protein